MGPRYVAYMRDGRYLADLGGPEFTLTEAREAIQDAHGALLEDPEWVYVAEHYSFEVRLYHRDGATPPETVESYRFEASPEGPVLRRAQPLSSMN